MLINSSSEGWKLASCWTCRPSAVSQALTPLGVTVSTLPLLIAENTERLSRGGDGWAAALPSRSLTWPASLRAPHCPLGSLTSSPSRNLINFQSSHPHSLPRLGFGTLQMQHSRSIFMQLHLCAVKRSLLMFASSKHLPHRWSITAAVGPLSLGRSLGKNSR